MLELSLFRNRTFVGANLTILMVALAMFGVFFFVSLYMQNVLRYSPVKAGAAFLPMTLLIAMTAPLTGRLSDRVGSRWLLTGGMTLVGLQLLSFSRLGVDSGYGSLAPGMVLGAFGMASVMAPGSAAALSGVPVDKAGVGSAVVNTSRQVGGSIGIALMGAIMAHELGGRTTPEAFVHGLSIALPVAAGIAFAGAIAAASLVRTHSDVSSARHGRTVAREAKLLRNVVEKGESPATPAIVAAVVLLCVVPIILVVIGSDTLAARF